MSRPRFHRRWKPGDRVGRFRVQNYGGRGRWRILCHCGETFLCNPKRLRQRRQTGCGSCRESSVFRYSPGQRVGQFQLLEHWYGGAWVSVHECGGLVVGYLSRLLRSRHCRECLGWDRITRAPGLQIGPWTLLRHFSAGEARERGATMPGWVARCQCGRERWIQISSLRIYEKRLEAKKNLRGCEHCSRAVQRATRKPLLCRGCGSTDPRDWGPEVHERRSRGMNVSWCTSCDRKRWRNGLCLRCEIPLSRNIPGRWTVPTCPRCHDGARLASALRAVLRACASPDPMPPERGRPRLSHAERRLAEAQRRLNKRFLRILADALDPPRPRPPRVKRKTVSAFRLSREAAGKPVPTCRTPGCPSVPTATTGLCRRCFRRQDREVDQPKPSPVSPSANPETP